MSVLLYVVSRLLVDVPSLSPNMYQRYHLAAQMRLQLLPRRKGLAEENITPVCCVP